MNNKNFIIVTIILAAVAILALISYLPARTDSALKIKVSDFPMQVGEWVARDLPVEEDVYRILETRNLFIREYKKPDANPVYLYIVYSEDNRKVSHPPEVCLLGSGMSVVNKSPVKVTDSLNAIKLVVENKNLQELVVYWYKAGDLFTDQYLKQQLKVVTDRMFGKRTAGAMIKVSTVIKNDNPHAALDLIKSFSKEIEPLLAKYVP